MTKVELDSLLTRAIDSLLCSNLPGLAALFRISAIDFTHSAKVPTLRLWFNPREARGRIEINARFATDYLETPLKLAAALAHELLHHLFRHFVLYPSDRMTNLSQDVLINALIYRLAPSFQQLFTALYEKTEFPGMALRPGANLKRIEDEGIRAVVTGFHKKLYRKASRSLTLGYLSDPKSDPDVISVDDLAYALQSIANMQDQIMDANLAAGRDEMFGLKGVNRDWYGRPRTTPPTPPPGPSATIAIVRPSTPGSPPPTPTPPTTTPPPPPSPPPQAPPEETLLLGYHAPEGELDDDDTADSFAASEFDEATAGDFAELLDSLVGDLSANPNASALFKRAFKIDLEEAPDALIEAFNAALREDVLRMAQIVEAVVGPKPNLTSVLPLHFGRKEIFLIGQGITPFFYPAYGPTETPEGDVAVYIDVSGSMGDQAKFIVMLMTAFKHRIPTEFYEFSTVIAEVNFGEFLERFEATGEISLDTTGGTDFSPIFEHAQAKGHEKILLITDGGADVNDEMTAFAQSIETYVVFTEHHQAEPLTSLSRAQWVMPAIAVRASS